MDVLLFHVYASRECVYRVVAYQWVYMSQYVYLFIKNCIQNHNTVTSNTSIERNKKKTQV
jgi:hypothetical protein